MKKYILPNIITITVITLLLFMTVGYALYSETVTLNGNVTIAKSGIIEITSASIVENECSNLSNYTAPTYSGMNINFSVTGSSEKFSATYLIEITNNSFYDYTFTDFAFNPTIQGSENTAKISTTITNANTGYTIGPGDSYPKGSVTLLKVKINFETENANTTVGVTGNSSLTVNNEGSLVASISPNTGDLQNYDYAEFNLNVINTYHYTRTFSIISSNENIVFVDSNYNPITTLSIESNKNENYKIYATVKEGSIFLTDSTTTTPYITSNGIGNITLPDLTLAVNIDINATDKEIPQVGNVTLTMAETNTVNGEATLSWTRIDSGGSPITNYYIILYNETTGTSNTYSTGNAITSYTFTNLAEGTYYATVYGEDEAGNIGSTYISSATTANGYASRSESIFLKWLYNVDTSGLNRLASDGATTAIVNNAYEATLSVNTSTSGYSLPSSITVTMNGQELTSGTDYTYNSSSGKVIINKVTGDIVISGAATWYCLIEGTKVRLANGTYKRIENIRYDDLLTVYDHENGGITYEYPVWIEKETKVNHYQKTTFSDGTILNTFGDHGLFSMDLLKYVSVQDKNNFSIGTNIAKIKEDGSIEVIKVTNIEIIKKETSYYNVSSTRFHNIIAEDLLTTDGSITSSNVFSFNNDITWSKERDDYLKTNDLFIYEEFQIVFPQFPFPEHIFRGYRMEEMKHLYNQGLLDINMYYQNLKNLGSDTMKDKENNNVWMITTSDDKIINKNDYLQKEGSYYKLPYPKKYNNFKGWYNTADGKLYKPNDLIKVVYGMHFIAKYYE